MVFCKYFQHSFNKTDKSYVSYLSYYAGRIRVRGSLRSSENSLALDMFRFAARRARQIFFEESVSY